MIASVGADTTQEAKATDDVQPSQEMSNHRKGSETEMPSGAPGTTASLPSNSIGAYSQRELLFVQREEKGELSFKYIKNDGNIQNLEWCVLL
jgi:hypothetical protein